MSLTKGAVLTPADLTERGMSILLSVIQASTTTATRPKLVTITANGINDRLHSILPLPVKLFSGWALRLPYKDKLNQEKVIEHAAGWNGDKEGWLGAQNVVIVRPALFVSGECKADKDASAYRTGQELKSAWTISREDVGHFVAEKVFKNWDQWAGKPWVISY